MADTIEINVERLEVFKTGTNRKTGRPWTLYIAHLRDQIPVDDHGTEIRVIQIKTFDNLSAGVQNVEIEYTEHGPLAKRPRVAERKSAPTPHGGNGNGSVAQLQADVDALRREVADLNRKFDAALRAWDD